jgi:hypothetical protein
MSDSEINVGGAQSLKDPTVPSLFLSWIVDWFGVHTLPGSNRNRRQSRQINRADGFHQTILDRLGQRPKFAFVDRVRNPEQS